jgi:hypothetical protein
LSTYADAILADSPTYYWEARDFGEGARLVDAVAGNTMTKTGVGHWDLDLFNSGGSPVVWVDGAIRSANYVGGSSAPFQAATPWRPTGAYSAEGWIYVRADDAASFPMLMASANDQDGWQVFFASSNWRYINKITGRSFGTDTLIGATTVTNDTAYHVVVTRNAGGLMTLYVNGASDGTLASDPGLVEYDSGGATWIGAKGPAGAPTNHTGGFPMRVAFYDYELTSGQVAAHYAAGQVPDPTLDGILVALNGGDAGSVYQMSFARLQDDSSVIRQHGRFHRPGHYIDGLYKDPWLVDDGSGGFIMYYSADVGGSVRNIAYATSPDGIVWTDQGVTFAGTDFAGGGGQFPVVLHDPLDTPAWKMWYGAGTNEQTGYATSSDGITWTPDGANPILTLGGSYDSQSALVGVVVKDGSTWTMLYGGADGTGGSEDFTLCVATASAPGGPFTKDAGNPLLAPRTFLQNVTVDVAPGDVIVHVASTAAVRAGEPLLLVNGSNLADGRVLSVDSGTQITLADPAPFALQVAAPGSVRSLYLGSIFPRCVLPTDTGFDVYGTSFEPGFSNERAIVMTCDTLTGTYDFDDARSPMVPLDGFNFRSLENPMLLAGVTPPITVPAADFLAVISLAAEFAPTVPAADLRIVIELRGQFPPPAVDTGTEPAIPVGTRIAAELLPPVSPSVRVPLAPFRPNGARR